MNRSLLLLVLAIVGVPRSAIAQEGEFLDLDDPRRERAPFVSLDAIDSEARSRFHLSSRVTFDDGNDAFTKSTRWTYELHAAIRLSPGVALIGTLPFGLDAPSPGGNTFFVGNVRLGVEGGFPIAITSRPTDGSSAAPRLRVGLGFDMYGPTAPNPGPQQLPIGLSRDSISAVRQIRSYDPELYMSRVASFRLRTQADFRLDILAAQLELGLAPAFTAREDPEFLMFFHWLFRVAVQPVRSVEPYLELGSVLHIVGSEPLFDLTTNVHLTLGVRGHFTQVDPALFVTIDLASGTPIFGVDLAGIVTGFARDDDTDEDMLDF